MKKIFKKSKKHVALNEKASAKSTDASTRNAMRNLLVGHNDTIDDKIATVKIAQKVDSGRFETALKTLMTR